MKKFAFLLLISLLTNCNTSNTALVTSVPTPLPDIDIRSECPTIESKISSLTANGTLIIDGIDTTYLMNMPSMTMTQINKPREALQEFAVSPNRTWIAYNVSMLDENLNYLLNNLVVADNGNQIYKTLPWEKEWGVVKWLDNERLLIKMIPQVEPNPPTNYKPGFLVLNPFTGERQTLTVDYPNIYNFYPVPDWDGWSITVFNPALTRVVYLKGDGSGPFYYVLWDMQNKEQITDFQIIGDLAAIPRWSLDGERFAFAPSLFSKMNEYPSYELYDVTKDGHATQLTHLTDYYPWVYIADLSWSPDSHHIAFWFTHWHQDESPSFESLGDRYLAILNTETGLVTDYCINGEKNAAIGVRIYQPPLWSPDSKQVVVQSQVGDEAFKTILIDIQENRAFHIADDMTPVGWMVSP